MGNHDWLEYIESFDFVALIETFVDEHFDLSSVLCNYVKFVCPALTISYHGRRSGGVIVLVKKNVSMFVEEIRLDVKNIIILKLSKERLGSEQEVMYIYI